MTDKEYTKIIAYFKRIIDGTKWDGHVYAVGGCCRDYLLGLPVNDIDLAVELPDGGIKFARWLQRHHFIIDRPITFPRFGTAMIRLKAFPDLEVEIVQTRAEKYTDKNSRNPETAFGSITDDCLRRDLTVNSLYYDISNDRLLDITGRGESDIREGIIRTPMDPDTTYDDDPVRILRTIRFATRYGWKIDADTYTSMLRNIGRLEIVTQRRKRMELEKMLTGPRPVDSLQMCADTGALPYLVPELVPLLALPYSAGDTYWQQTLRLVGMVENNLPSRMAALYIYSGMGVNVDNANRNQASESLVMYRMRQLGFEKVQTQETGFLVRHSLYLMGKQLSERKLRQLQYLCGTKEMFETLMAFTKQYAAVNGLSNPTRHLRRMTQQMLQDGTAMFGYTLPVSDKEIMRIKHTKSETVVRSSIRHLMKLAYSNPRMTIADCERALIAYRPGK